MKLRWACIEQHLCVFANGDDLTRLMPPLPLTDPSPTQLASCLAQCFEIIDERQRQHGRSFEASRIEYVSDEMLEMIRAVPNASLQLSAAPMSGDYIYPTTDMIDLPGGPLKSKRKDRARFMRDHLTTFVRTLTDADLPACAVLLQQWTDHANAAHAGQQTDEFHRVATGMLRRRETAACRAALRDYRELVLTGLVVEEDGQLLGFALGESLSPRRRRSCLKDAAARDWPAAVHLRRVLPTGRWVCYVIVATRTPAGCIPLPSTPPHKARAWDGR